MLGVSHGTLLKFGTIMKKRLKDKDGETEIEFRSTKKEEGALTLDQLDRLRDIINQKIAGG